MHPDRPIYSFIQFANELAGVSVKVSPARSKEARELCDIVLALLDRHGSNLALVDRDRRIKTRQIEVGDLRIMQSAPMGVQILDVYHGPKVFSVNWNDVDAIEVVAFKPGEWRQLLRSLGDNASAFPNAGAPQSVAVDSGSAFVTREFLEKRVETLITEFYGIADLPQQSAPSGSALLNNNSGSTDLSPRVKANTVAGC